MTDGFFECLLFPHKCVGCKEKFNVFATDFDRNAVYCANCRVIWERVKILPCPACRMAGVECRCVPDILDGLDVASLFRFGHEMEADRLVYCLKRKKLSRVFGFAAEELAVRMRSFSRERMIDLSNAIITHVPRNNRSDRKSVV